jgi:molybdopterin-guanine dinucleotide biosynthesis protein A
VSTAFCAAILAGGRARRLGGARKALLEVDGRAIVDLQLDVLAPRTGRIAAVLAHGDDDQPFTRRGLTVLRDPIRGAGPIAALSGALAWASGDALLALACDMPFIDGRVVDLVVARARGGADLAVPIADGRVQPLLACYGARCRALVDAALAAGEWRLASLPDAARATGLTVEEIAESEIRTIDPELRSLVNINEPSDRIWIERR